ncbi:hypothetical protein DLD77_02660 [Chitinophaga alhagiae]|uniref:Uncharacterized protein n=1 Tax=Chitinophaga alhagiae TaxID=2203219 RepID=A0ABM6W9R2_9BACT|nr:hypothetical protein [Chitinophaga alhagiae]AWO00674.1 hypothetical protein DLD77_02660 [Chitinophaga alhagiae]
MHTHRKLILLPALIALIISSCGTRRGLEGFTYTETFHPREHIVRNDFDFDGYTDHWHSTHQQWSRYGNLFKTLSAAPEKAVLRSKLDIADDLGVPGLFMQEGFLDELQAAPYAVLDQPGLQQLEDSLQQNNALVITTSAAETGQALEKKFNDNSEALQFIASHTSGSARVNAYMLKNGSRRLFVISAPNIGLARKVQQLTAATMALLKDYDLHRGWFGAQTLYNSVTCSPGHPLEVIGKGMNEGNSWFVFDGYMEFLSKNELREWMGKVTLPVVTDVGVAGPFPAIFGCENYDSLQVQAMNGPEWWVTYAHSKKGYAFRKVYDTLADAAQLPYDGYFATEGDKEWIDHDSIPFVYTTGLLESGAVPSMVLFHPKGAPLSDAALWKAILDRRGVAVLAEGKMMGPAGYRHALDMLLLDRVFLEKYFGDQVNIEAAVEGYNLNITLRSISPQEISGTLDLRLPGGLKTMGDTITPVQIPAGGTKRLSFRLQPEAAAMGAANPIAVHYKWGNTQKSTLAMLDLPPAISVHRLLYGHTPVVTYPVAIHNFSKDTAFPVTVTVIDSTQPARPVFEAQQNCTTATSQFSNLQFDLKVPAGNYTVKVTALGTETTSQLGVGAAAGTATLTEADLNNDGINEYMLENDSVKVTLLATGARIIEYIVKEKEDNVLFKLWPDKPVDDRRPFRKQEFYPYGGFEDFLGQPSIETGKNYDVTVLKKEGDYVQVKMTADYYGNKLEKIYTLYGNSPLVEARFALTFKNPELKMLGPQPMLALGKAHGPEDVHIFPDREGLRELTMDPAKYYGRVFFPREGWNAAYDRKEDITFVGAFPVDQPIFLHLWMNHPSNPGSHYFYSEMQPWVRIYQKSTMYFSYYLWASAGPWQRGVAALRGRNLVTVSRH